MTEYHYYFKREKNGIIDPILIENKYAIYSTFENDVIFSQNNKNPLFCGGIIKDVHPNVYNFKKNQWVSYLSFKKEKIIELSSNLIFKIDEPNKDLIFALPYASYSFKILRIINPSLGQSIIIIGKDFFSKLLRKVLKLSGAHVTYFDSLNSNIDIKNYTISNGDNFILINTLIDENINKFIKQFLEKKKGPIMYTTLSQNLKKTMLKKTLKLRYVDFCDIGLNDSKYLKGVRYPYSYVRWDYHENIFFFLNLFNRGKIELELEELNFKFISFRSLDEELKRLPKNSNNIFKLE